MEWFCDAVVSSVTWVCKKIQFCGKASSALPLKPLTVYPAEAAWMMQQAAKEAGRPQNHSLLIICLFFINIDPEMTLTWPHNNFGKSVFWALFKTCFLLDRWCVHTHLCVRKALQQLFFFFAIFIFSSPFISTMDTGLALQRHLLPRSCFCRL